MKSLEDFLTVDELIEKLMKVQQEGNGNMPVAFTYPSGDHWQTEIASPIDDVAYGLVEYTEYHISFKVVDEEDIEQYEEENGAAPEGNVVLIK